jgi:aspartyl-tRNA(Asn)/glutamyl-tRNA(Gln) amidotransferase subunit C
MVMPVEIDIARVARLARIALSEEELDKYGRQLEHIVEYAVQVQALPTDGVPPTSHVLPMTNAFRPDEVTPSLDRDEILAQAPDSVDGYFRVPRILEQAAGDEVGDT